MKTKYDLREGESVMGWRDWEKKIIKETGTWVSFSMKMVEETMGEKLESGQINNYLFFVCAVEGKQTQMPRTKG